MVKVSAPGKVCIAGEWAVLEKGNSLIVASVNKRIFADVKKSKDDFIYISIKDFGIKRLKASINSSCVKNSVSLPGDQPRRQR